ncbi:C2H2-type domain-containing protein [Lamellibrachia satsuma]|nr:C2H2-type domain-containing protein [Lamellibrachia satsuma]
MTFRFTCISCRVTFADADIQRSHYKTDWHRYNLKRKVAELPPVTAENFRQRVLTLKEQEVEKDVSNYCQVCTKHFSTNNAYESHMRSKRHRDTMVKQAQSKTKNERNRRRKKGGEEDAGTVTGGGGDGDAKMEAVSGKEEEDIEEDSDAESCESWEGDAVGIEECLFCSHISNSLEKNVEHMTVKHSFFIPDADYLSDLEGLVIYLGQKVGEGHVCVWCNERGRSFQTTKAVQRHMIDKGHCKMLHEGDALLEYSDFYDYRSSYPDYHAGGDGATTAGNEGVEEGDGVAEEVDLDVLNDVGYQLVLPSGATVGHRSLLRYYRQNLKSDSRKLVNTSSVSRMLAQYKALGWTGTTGNAAQKRAKDISFVQRLRAKHYTKMGVKGNILPGHFRSQVFNYF